MSREGTRGCCVPNRARTRARVCVCARVCVRARVCVHARPVCPCALVCTCVRARASVVYDMNKRRQGSLANLCGRELVSRSPDDDECRRCELVDRDLILQPGGHAHTRELDGVGRTVRNITRPRQASPTAHSVVWHLVQITRAWLVRVRSMHTAETSVLPPQQCCGAGYSRSRLPPSALELSVERLRAACVRGEVVLLS